MTRWDWPLAVATVIVERYWIIGSVMISYGLGPSCGRHVGVGVWDRRAHNGIFHGGL